MKLTANVIPKVIESAIIPWAAKLCYIAMPTHASAIIPPTEVPGITRISRTINISPTTIKMMIILQLMGLFDCDG